MAFLTAARWVHFVSLFLLFGSTVFWAHTGRGTLPATRARIGGLTRPLALVVATSGIAWLAGSIANMIGDFGSLLDAETLHAFFFETGFGPLAIARLALFAAIVAVSTLRIEARLPVLSLLSGLLLVSQAWLGHAAEDAGTLHGAAMIASYAVHVLFAAAWVGGLVPLAFGVVERAGERTPAGPPDILRLLLRFSTVATVFVVAVFISGIVNSAFRVGVPTIPEALSPYGLILLAKIGLVTAMLGMAALNRFVLMPDLDRISIRIVASGIIAEFALGILVLGAAAVLGITPPPR